MIGDCFCLAGGLNVQTSHGWREEQLAVQMAKLLACNDENLSCCSFRIVEAQCYKYLDFLWCCDAFETFESSKNR
jgi:hypothetical protein